MRPFYFSCLPQPPKYTLFPYTTLFRSAGTAPSDGYPSSKHGRNPPFVMFRRSEDHTSELQSRLHLVCRLLLEKKKQTGCCSFSFTCATVSSYNLLMMSSSFCIAQSFAT